MSDNIPEDPWSAQDYTPIDGEAIPPEEPAASPPDGGVDLPPAPQATLAELVMNYRDITGLTQNELWRNYDIDVSALSEIENGKTKRPSPKTLHRLSRAFSDKLAGSSPERIYQHLLAARDARPMPSLPVAELAVMDDRMRRYPNWYQRIVGKALLELMDSFEELYKKMR